MPSLRVADAVKQESLYSFHDLLLMIVATRMLDTGVSLQNIRVAIEHISQKTLNEITRITLFSDGVTVYEVNTEEELLDLLAGGQGVFGIAVSGALRGMAEAISRLEEEEFVVARYP